MRDFDRGRARRATARSQEMAGSRGEISNRLGYLEDDLFKELEHWEAILNELPDFDVNENCIPIQEPN
ncbi:hypothetical protein [Stappia sp. MMSF_3263]|uniref:hypothetical protein n=1 Tax=Stappia sp. MMSF_3263 TaxID=3046693 RepID=UPI00273FBCE3|nr:hypothetical protein [Stappia sp. MMSF_3263]